MIKIGMPRLHCYNGSLARLPDGDYIFAWRRDADHVGKKGSIWMGQLNRKNWRVIGKDFPVIRGAEDPRFFWFDGRLHLGYVRSPLGANSFIVAQQAYGLVENIKTVTHRKIVKTGKVTEKNWTFFDYNGRLMAHYMISPQIVFDVETRETYKSPPMTDWVWGWPHGGTSPVLIDEGYICLFQSYLWMPKHKTTPNYLRNFNRIYFIGACLFEPDPPFRILRYTKTPFEFGKWHKMAFGLVIEDDGTVLITYGVNDSECFAQEVGLDVLLSGMSPLIEEKVFIRNAKN